jgi:hypothetical protein
MRKLSKKSLLFLSKEKKESKCIKTNEHIFKIQISALLGFE